MGALWQLAEKDRPALETPFEGMLRDWDFYTSQKRSQPEEVAAVPLLAAIENDPTKEGSHAMARRAKATILGIHSERW